jgi:hypothetical protein
MSAIIGKITTTATRPRGPDVQMSVTVPLSWFLAGATLEIALPRNLTCAACAGGGCDACRRSGAVSLRAKKAAPENVEVTLPKPKDGASEPARAIVMRIPERGGLSLGDDDLPRGNLLLAIRDGDETSPGVTRLAGPSVPPPELPAELLEGVVPSAILRFPRRRRALLLLLVGAALVALFVALVLRTRG